MRIYCDKGGSEAGCAVSLFHAWNLAIPYEAFHSTDVTFVGVSGALLSLALLKWEVRASGTRQNCNSDAHTQMCASTLAPMQCRLRCVRHSGLRCGTGFSRSIQGSVRNRANFAVIENTTNVDSYCIRRHHQYVASTRRYNGLGLHHSKVNVSQPLSSTSMTAHTINE